MPSALSTPLSHTACLTLILTAATAALLPGDGARAGELALAAAYSGPFQDHAYAGYALVLHEGLRPVGRRARLFIGASLGAVAGRGERAAMASAGPGIELRLGTGARVPHLRYELHGAVLSRHRFGTRDLGGPFQFFHRLALAWPVGRRHLLAAGLWHISNGGVYDVNPGLSGFSLELGVRY